MKIEKAVIQNNPYIGIFCLSADNFVLHPPHLSKGNLSSLSLLSKNLIPFTIAGTSLLSIFGIANSNGVVLNQLVSKEELAILKKNKIKTLQLPTLKTIGNMCSVSNSKGLISPELSEFKKEIEEHLNISLLEITIGSSFLTGSCSVLNDKGAIVSPRITQEELEKIKNFLGTEVIPSSVNFGDIFPGTGILLNSNTILVGQETSSIELSKIFDAFGGN